MPDNELLVSARPAHSPISSDDDDGHENDDDNPAAPPLSMTTTTTTAVGDEDDAANVFKIAAAVANGYAAAAAAQNDEMMGGSAASSSSPVDRQLDDDDNSGGPPTAAAMAMTNNNNSDAGSVIDGDKHKQSRLLMDHVSRIKNKNDYEERDIEQDLLQARRLTMEKAQADLLAGFGLGFPMLGGLHYLPAGHPFLPTAAAAAAAASLHSSKSLAPVDLLNLSTLMQHQGLLTSPTHASLLNSALQSCNPKPTADPLSQQSPYNAGRLVVRHSPAVGCGGNRRDRHDDDSSSPGPEDLSLSGGGRRDNFSPGHRSSRRSRQQQQQPVATPFSRTPPLLVGGGGGGSSDEYPDLSLSPATVDATGAAGSSQHQQNWSFEEQFKQLYDLGPDQKRKEFLDDLFSFMQKRGTPVTRIPIMAKQVLDLYELYKLVVSHGGLVEVINKKLWREITKGLNLPSSITSAAFTLRTQYMKYLYPYECEKEKLSCPSELQTAIDGNRREGRRTGYHPYSQMSPTLLPPASATSRHHHLNGGAPMPDDDGLGPTPTLTQQAFAAAYREQALALEAAQRHFEMSQRESQRRTTSDGASSCSNESLINDDTPMTPLDASTNAPRPNLYSNSVSPIKTLARLPINGGPIGSALRLHDPSSLLNGHSSSTAASCSSADGSPTSGGSAVTIAAAAAAVSGTKCLTGGQILAGAAAAASSRPVPSSAPAVVSAASSSVDSGGGGGNDHHFHRGRYVVVVDQQAVRRRRLSGSAMEGTDENGAGVVGGGPPLTTSSAAAAALNNKDAAALSGGCTQSMLPTTHIKVTSRYDGQTKVDSSLVVSMEINGIMYQGVLFAQPAH